MTITIRSNIAALKARTQLDRATQGISKSFERLSSGLRINSAVDDAAGLAVSSSLNVDIRISRRGKLNVSDGASAVDIASSAVTQISSLLTRMAELANQSANGTFSDSQRKPIQREYEQLDREIRRIAETTSFNGLDLLKGEQVTSQSAASLFSVLLAGDSSRPSGDGRYVTYNDGNGNIYQHDSQTGVDTLIAATGESTADFDQSADGSIVAYESGTEIYIYNKRTSETTQVTNTAGGGGVLGTFTLSADGSAVVFFSSTHYTNGGTKDDVSGSGSVRMAHVDLNTGIFQTLSDTTSNYTDLVISADGSRVAFRSNNDLTGQNSDGGFEVFTVEFNGSPSYVQATNATSGGVRAVGIDDSGKVYLRTARDIQGLNPSGLQNIFQYDLTSGTYVNVTGKTASETIDNYMLTADGSALMILTKADLTGENPNNYTQAFRYELHLGTVRQVTNFDSELSKDAASGQFSYDGHSLLISQTNITAEFLSLSLVPENSELDVELGSGAEGRIASALHALNGSLRGLGGFMISSQSAALGALDRVNSNIDEAAQILGVLGAALNRFSIADSVLDKSALEFAAARSRITDVDVAEESANLLRGQIVQQTASALLAQANVQPQLALILLGGI